MLWFTPIILAFSLYFTTKNLKNKSIWFLAGMGFGWCVNLIAFLFYITSHNFYYHVVSRYFAISTDIRRSLSELRIPLSQLARAMNIGSTIILYCALCFAVSYAYPSIKRKRYMFLLSVPMLFQIILFDPAIYRRLYLFAANMTGDFALIEQGKNIIYTLSQITNHFYLLASVTILCIHLIKCKVKVIRIINTCILTFFVCFLFIFFSVFREIPHFWLNVTTVSPHVSYNALDVASNNVLMQYFPYIILLGVGTISFALYRYNSVESGYHSRQLRISAELRQFSMGLAVISHSLKNQLLCIEEEACQLLDKFEKKERREELLAGIETIQRYSRKMFNSLSYLNKHIKIQRFELDLISLTELCHEIVCERSHIPETIHFEIILPKEDIRCYAARPQLKECILNLLSNAAEAVDPTNGHIRFSLEQYTNWAILTVTDNGCGISKEDQAQIFHPFYSTKPSSKNWGIGLSTCSQIIEVHGGKLLVNSESNHGSTFQILLSVVY